MKTVSKIIRAPLKLLGLVPKVPKPNSGPMVPKAATRDDARDAAMLEDDLRKRRGGAADILTGGMGAEAGAGGKTQLG